VRICVCGHTYEVLVIQFSWRSAFIALHMTLERDKLWMIVLRFFPLYVKAELA